jgi:hypothetical protein
MEVIATIAAVVAAVAAVGALWLARQTIIETRLLRREDRLARLPEIVADVATTAQRAMTGGQPVGSGYAIARLRLEAAVAASGESLPVCEALAKDYLPGEASPEAVSDRARAALDELTPLLRTAPPAVR